MLSVWCTPPITVFVSAPRSCSGKKIRKNIDIGFIIFYPLWIQLDHQILMLKFVIDVSSFAEFRK